MRKLLVRSRAALCFMGLLGSLAHGQSSGKDPTAGPGGFNVSKPAQAVADVIGDYLEVRGAITQLRESKGALGMILIEAKDGKPFDMVWLHVSKDTKILKLDGKERKAASFEDLQVGVRIEARTDKSILKSDPPQTLALEIVILSAQKK